MLTQATFNVEVVEGRHLPSPLRGGQPDPIVTITCVKRPAATVRTQVLVSSNTPVYNQTFCFDGCDEIEEFELAVYDRDLSQQSLLAKTRFQMGGPGKSVGSRYFALSRMVSTVEADGTVKTATLEPTAGTDAPSVHLVWSSEMKQVEPKVQEEFSIAALQGGVQKATMRVDVTPVKGGGDDATTAALFTETTSAPGSPMNKQDPAEVLRNTAVTQEVLDTLVSLSRTVRRIETTMTTFQETVERKLATTDARILEIETVLSIRNTMRATTTEAMLKDETSKVAKQRELRASSDQRTMESRLEKPAGSLPAVVNVAGEVNTIGALSSILAHPTKISAHDQQLLANYTYHQVNLPEAPHGGDRPISKAKPGDNLERRIAASTLGLQAQVNQLTSTQ